MKGTRNRLFLREREERGACVEEGKADLGQLH